MSTSSLQIAPRPLTAVPDQPDFIAALDQPGDVVRAPFPRIPGIHGLALRVRAAATVRDALAQLPDALVRLGGFARVVVSTVDGGGWTPAFEQSDLGAGLEPALRGLVMRFAPGLVETEVARRKTGRVVSSAERDPRAAPALVDRARLTSYVVAPLVTGDETIALIHADHGAGRHPVSEQDLELVGLVADFVGIALESQELSDVIAAENRRTLAALAQAAALFTAQTGDEGTTALVLREHRAAASAPREWNLSSREEDVLELVAHGLGNRDIADRLFVSESTVKSHIKHIFRKLGVTSRSEAIALAVRRWAGREQAAS